MQLVKLIDPITIIPGGLVPRGAYNEATSYIIGDSVTYNGSSYVLYADTLAGTLPTDATKWQILASKGDTGNDGSQGVQGLPGANGTNGVDGLNGADGNDGVGVPMYGTTGQVLAKNSNTDYDTEWIDLPTIPDELSDLTADATHRLVTDTEKTTWNSKAAGDHNHTGVYAPVLGADDNYVTDAEKVKLSNLSGTNTGDQTLPVKATGAEVDTGTDDAKFVTAKAMEDSSYIKSTGNAATATALATPRAINGVNFDGTAAINITEAIDHGTASTDQLVNVCYGTGSPPTASDTTEGTLFIKYTP